MSRHKGFYDALGHHIVNMIAFRRAVIFYYDPVGINKVDRLTVNLRFSRPARYNDVLPVTVYQKALIVF